MRDPLHLGALLCGLAAIFWALTTIIGAFFLPAFLLGLTAGITLLVRRRAHTPQKQLLRSAAVSLIAAHAILLMLFIITTPVNIGEDPDRGFNLHPPQWAQATIEVYASIFIVLAAMLLPAGIVLYAGTLERVLAATGALVVLIVIVLGALTAGNDALALLMQALMALAFFAIAAACLLPPWRREDPLWDGE
jgi:hypothetical protein